MKNFPSIFAQRMSRLKPSATRGMADKAAQVAASGKQVISFTTGEPDFSSPAVVKEYAMKAIADDATHYTPTGGTAQLKQAIADYYKDRHGVAFSANEIIVGAGAKAVLFEALGVLLDPGDEVIVTTPAWVSYVEQIEVFDGVPVLVDTSQNGFIPRIEDVARAVTDKTAAIMINTPHNPTGTIYPQEFMRDLCLLAKERGFYVFNDEIYERLAYDGIQYTNPLATMPEARDVMLTVNGVSKTFAMTGWRIGYGLGPSSLIGKMAALQGHITSCASSVSQWAAVGALLHAQPDVEMMVREYDKRRQYVVQRLQKMPHVQFVHPNGAFYVFIDVRGCLGKSYKGMGIENDTAFCELLLEHGLVAFVPGTAFLAPGFMRMSYATSMSNLEQGLDNLQGVLEALK